MIGYLSESSLFSALIKIYSYKGEQNPDFYPQE